MDTQQMGFGRIGPYCKHPPNRQISNLKFRQLFCSSLAALLVVNGFWFRRELGETQSDRT